jgi:predicted secreted Zn-dependent protease
MKDLVSYKVSLLIAVLVLVLVALIASSCNVTRVVSTKAEYFQRGDTTTTIVTKTTESYDGSVKRYY